MGSFTITDVAKWRRILKHLLVFQNSKWVRHGSIGFSATSSHKTLAKKIALSLWSCTQTLASKLKPGQYHIWQKLNKWAVFSQEITLFTIKQDVKEYELLPCRGIMNPYHSIYHSEESPKKVSYSAGVLLSPDLHAISELTGTHFQFQWDQSTDNRYSSNILNLSAVISPLLT